MDVTPLLFSTSFKLPIDHKGRIHRHKDPWVTEKALTLCVTHDGDILPVLAIYLELSILAALSGFNPDTIQIDMNSLRLYCFRILSIQMESR